MDFLTAVKQQELEKALAVESATGGVLCNVYIDLDVDALVRSIAHQERAAKGRVFRRLLNAGMAMADAGHPRASLPTSEDPPMVRQVELPTSLDETLTNQAAALKIPKTVLIQQYVRMALSILSSNNTGP